MSKSKHKRKREHAQQQAKQEAPQTGLNESEMVHAHQKASPEGADHRKRQNKQDNSMVFGERIKQYGITDWLLAVFTLALVGTSIYQMVILGGQLDTMRTDQRAWLVPTYDEARLRMGNQSDNLSTVPTAARPLQKRFNRNS